MSSKSRVILGVAVTFAVLGVAAAAKLGKWQWNQFIPDLIVSLTSSIVVGVGVGLALWRFQVTAESRELVRASESDWRISKARVEGAMSKLLDPWYSPQSVMDAASQLDRVLEVGGSLPVGQWSDASPDNQELKLLAELLIEGTRYQTVAKELDADFKPALLRVDNEWRLRDEYVRYMSVLAQDMNCAEQIGSSYDLEREQIAAAAISYLDSEIAAYQAQRVKAELIYSQLQGKLLNLPPAGEERPKP